MSIDFPAILILITIFTGAVSLADMIYCRIIKHKDEKDAKKPVLIDYSRAFFPVLLAVFCIRTFLVQPYRVPTGSLKPTVMPGDFYSG